jgi:GNAT superfamily N-acetyltransferase
MKIYRRTSGIKAILQKATESDLIWAEREFPEDLMLPTLSEMDSWMLIINDEYFGFIEYLTRDSEMTVTGLWVRPDKRGNGYGTMMLELAEVSEKPDIIRVITTPRSEGFYAKRGYAPDFGMKILTKVCEYD